MENTVLIQVHLPEKIVKDWNEFTKDRIDNNPDPLRKITKTELFGRALVEFMKKWNKR